MQPIQIVVSAQTGGAESAMKRVVQATDTLDRKIKASSTAMNQWGGQLSRSETGLNRWAKGALQQAGFQVGDFAVQVANGTNKMQAFGQQASQLLGVFGPWGAILGAGVAIVSAIVVAFQKSAAAADEAAGKTMDLGEAFETLEGLTRHAGHTLDEYITMKFDNATGAMGRFFDFLREREQEAARGSIAKFFEGVDSEIKAAEEAVEGLNQALQDMATYGDLPEFSSLARQNVDIWSAVLENIGLTADEVGRMRAALDQIIASGSTDELTENLASARDMAADIGGPVGDAMLSAISAAAVSAGVLKKNMEGARESAAAMMTTGTPLFKQGMYDSTLGLDLLPPDPEKPKARSSGAAAIDKLQQAYERLRGSLDPAWKATQDFNEAQDTLNKAFAAGKITAAEYADLMGKLKDKYADLKNPMQEVADTMKSALSSGFTAIIEGTKSVTAAFRDMARAVIAKLFDILVVQQLVGSFDMASGKGSGIMGFLGRAFSGLTIGARASGGPVTAGRPYIVGEKRPELFIPSSSGRILPSTGGTGAVVVNQTINIETGVSQTVRTEMMQLMPRIAESSKAAVFDAMRRGAFAGAT